MKDLYYVLMKNNLGQAGVCKKMIKQGQVIVNGQKETDCYYQVALNDLITCQNQAVKAQPFTYIMLNKPAGYLCANHDRNDPCVFDLLPDNKGSCLGRLDKDTTGLLLISDDKSLKKLLMPQNHIEKTYLVTTRYPIEKSIVTRFEQGIVIDKDIVCKKAKLKIIDDFHCYVTIVEGRYHQIKKMFLSIKNEVIALKRISFAGLLLDRQLPLGQYRYLTNDEILSLYRLLDK